MNKRSFFTRSVQRMLLGISTHWRATYASKTAVVLLMVAYIGEAIREAFDPKRFSYYE